MGGDEKTKDEKIDSESDTNPKLAKQLDDVVKVFDKLEELSSNQVDNKMTADPIQQAFFRGIFQDQIFKNPTLQKMIIENIFSKEEEKYLKSDPRPNSKTVQEDEEIPIQEILSPEDIYMIRIIGDEIEVVENHDGNVVYKRVKLSS